jgi:hypothetical protein
VVAGVPVDVVGGRAGLAGAAAGHEHGVPPSAGRPVLVREGAPAVRRCG